MLGGFDDMSSYVILSMFFSLF